MKKNYFIALLALVVNFASAQIEQTAYRGAFAPAPTAMWTDSWTSWDPQNEPYLDAATVVNQSTNITTNTTWTTGKTYKLTGLIYVTNNATLTIQPGVVVKGVYSNTGTALVITKGAKLNAVGTAANPIVFTSAKTAGSRAAGDWGGIVLLGKGGYNLNSGINNIEGITASVNTEYGGGTSPTDADNSGTMKYCRIEFPGFVFSPNNEINGLTFGAVGSGTTIDYVQVSYSGDDSFEWFGGAVNCKHLVAYRGVDDDFDTDNGYKGLVQFGLGIRDASIADNPAISTSEGFESDNNAGGTVSGTGYDNTKAIFTNMTLIGPAKRATLAPTASVASGHARALRLRRVTELKIYNSIFLDFKNNFLFVDGSTTVDNANAGKLKFKNNLLAGISSADAALYPKGVNPTSLNTWMENGGNVSQSSSADVLTMPYDATTNSFLGLDYRPGQTASTGADFTDASISPYVIAPAPGTTPVVTNRTYCKGEVATALTAALTTTGVSLKWYTVATAGTASTTAPTPSTSLAGVKNYWVSQVDGITGVESARVLLTVTTNALPTEVVSTITGQGPLVTAAGVDPILNPAVYASATAVGPFVGTTSAFTYSIAAFVDTTLTYLWTVPNGVNIVSGQGTNAITVNFLNAPAGAGALGTISVQAVNASGCKTLAKTLALTKVLPSAPTIFKMYNTASATPTTAITTFGQYMGTTTPLTLTAAFAATTLVMPAAYQWELPTGVNVAIPAGTVPVETTSTYSAEPFLSVASAPSTVGTKYWTVTEKAYTYDVNGVATTTKISTAAQKIVGSTKTYTFSISSNAANANAVNTLFTYNGNTYKLTTATTATSTTAVCTYSSAFPGTFPTALSTTVAGTLTPVTTGNSMSFSKIVVAGYDATTTQAYAPYGTRVRTNLSSILVNFAGVTNASTTKLYLGVKAVNGTGTSVTSNATNTDVVANNAIPGLFYTTYTETFVAPNATTLANATSVYTATGTTPTTAKLLTLTAALPTVPTLTLTNPASATPTTAITTVSKYVGTSTPLTLTASAIATASSYVWELPAGVNAVDLPVGAVSTTVDGITTINSTTSRSITINFLNVAPGTVTTTLYLGVKAKNGIGLSQVLTNGTLTPASTSTAKLLKVTVGLPAAVLTIAGQIAGVCGNNTYNYTITASVTATSYVITAPIGSVVTSESSPSNDSNVLATADLNFSVLFPANIATVTPKTIAVKSVNGYGTSATSKSVTITTAMPAILTVNGGSTFCRVGTQTFSIPAVLGASTYNWTVANGAVIVNGAGTNTIEVDFSAVPAANTTTALTVSTTNACAINSAVKTVTLVEVLCGGRIANNVELSNVSGVYPNPSTTNFNLDVTSLTDANVSMSVFNFYGNLVSTKNVKLSQGANTISEDISNLKNGIYFVKFYNASNNEILVKKLVKN
jgi:hypothetical protein